MYNVVLLVEQELTEPDARRIVELHESVSDQVGYHLIIPCENAAARVEASLATLAGTELYGLAAQRYHAESDQQLIEAQREAQRAIDLQAQASLDRSVERLNSADQLADGVITHERPVDTLVSEVDRTHGDEVIVLTRPHVVAEFFHVDWSAQARRHLGVPVLHLLEQFQDHPLSQS